VCPLQQSYDRAEFEALTAKYEKLNWRMISKPGGATVKPDDFYQLYGCASCSTSSHAGTVKVTGKRHRHRGASAGRRETYGLLLLLARTYGILAKCFHYKTWSACCYERHAQQGRHSGKPRRTRLASHGVHLCA